MEQNTFKFELGQPYAIINKAQDFALAAKQSNPSKFEESKMEGRSFDPQDDSQLFFIDKVGTKAGDYQIVNLLTNRVLTVEGRDVLLQFGKQKSSQLFSIVKSPFHGFFTYYWIKASKQENQGLYFDRSLRYGNFHSAAEDQMFRFQPVNVNNTIKNSFLFINKVSGKALDVPGGTLEPGERIIQYDVNKRFNQRWRWVQTQRGYLIQNLLNELYLDIAGESRESGAKVIQWTKTGNPNQQWIPEAMGNGSHRIRSVHEPSLFLSIKKQSIQNGGKLQVTNEHNGSMFWIIEGVLP